MSDSQDKQFRIIILGAGFSKAAGLPLGNELWLETRKRAKRFSPGDRAYKFHNDLNNYVEYKRKCDGVTLSVDKVDFEDFMRVLDVEHFLGLRGSDTWSEDGNEGTIVVKTLIGEILSELIPDNIPELYLEFARRLQPDDIVLTLNYDTLLERSLDIVGKPYRLFPDRYATVGEGSAIVDNSKDEVVILKLHGSIDWFDRKTYTEMEDQWSTHGCPTRPYHPVFGTSQKRDLIKILDGPRFDNDPLNHMYRLLNIKELYKEKIMFSATPWMLAPSALKIVYADKLRDFWRGLGRAGVFNFGLAIIGYSLPSQDEYARKIIYDLVDNYQNNHYAEGMPGRKKSPMVMVTFNHNWCETRRFKKRYGFVDWNRARLFEKGLNMDAIEAVFATM